jgi:hypothetical protein
VIDPYRAAEPRRLADKVRVRTLRAMVVSRLERYGIPVRALVCRWATGAALRRKAKVRVVLPPPLVVMAVYRAKNGRTMRGLIRQVGQPADIRLWSLDEVIPELADRTVGCGPGQKFELLNRLVADRPIDPTAYVVVVDDDVVLGRRSLATMVELMRRGGIGLAMPAQSAASHVSYGLNVRRPANVATRVPFVEIGPLFAVSPEWSSRLIPFPSDMAMGWGLDVRWSALADEGCRLAIMDACAMYHCHPPGLTYDRGPERSQLGEALAERGLKTLDEILVRQTPWRRWQRRPSWMQGEER